MISAGGNILERERSVRARGRLAAKLVNLNRGSRNRIAGKRVDEAAGHRDADLGTERNVQQEHHDKTEACPDTRA